MSATPVAAAAQYADQPDDELILRVRNGDSDAYAELWRRYFPLAVRVARRSTSRFDPEDLASEAFLTVLSAIRNGQGPDHAFRVYLMTVVRNMSAKWGSRQMEIVLEDPYQAAPPPPVDGLAALERDPRMVAAFTSLPVRTRSVLWYTIVEGFTPTELAPMLGISSNAAAVLALRGRKALRKAWLQAGPEDGDTRPTAPRHLRDVSAEGGAVRRAEITDVTRSTSVPTKGWKMSIADLAAKSSSAEWPTPHRERFTRAELEAPLFVACECPLGRDHTFAEWDERFGVGAFRAIAG
ncbi:RNA polymerase sigma factor [Leifsonia sp. 21MFCrub1.1]|uniref:RNA polymerase sigma factor n=1 Tax=Leifsonia sp. 21MFCrub1.1 TaxID=1798223 RepID=UPI0008929782|nr:sigma-70 family RNA polymerase sigma factor [Leifsonia sp. 21MFCrub1.1]SEA35393.1 RNA polymerase sigma factor, sigma-70 family [Leifsonia sp. 21MFCrub1.1]